MCKWRPDTAFLYHRVGNLLLTGKKPQKISIINEPDKYFSMPVEKDFDEYFKQRCFFRIRDLISFLLRKKH